MRSIQGLNVPRKKSSLVLLIGSWLPSSLTFLGDLIILSFLLELFPEVVRYPHIKFDKDILSYWYKPNISRDQGMNKIFCCFCLLLFFIIVVCLFVCFCFFVYFAFVNILSLFWQQIPPDSITIITFDVFLQGKKIQIYK